MVWAKKREREKERRGVDGTTRWSILNERLKKCLTHRSICLLLRSLFFHLFTRLCRIFGWKNQHFFLPLRSFDTSAAGIKQRRFFERDYELRKTKSRKRVPKPNSRVDAALFYAVSENVGESVFHVRSPLPLCGWRFSRAPKTVFRLLLRQW